MSCYQEEHDACRCARQVVEIRAGLDNHLRTHYQGSFEYPPEWTQDDRRRGWRDLSSVKKRSPTGPTGLMLALLIVVVLAIGFDIASLKPHRQTTVQAAGYTLTGDVVVQAPGMKVEVVRIGASQEVRVTK